MKKLLKNLLRNRMSDFGIISQDCSLCDPFKNCSQNFDPSKKLAAGGGGGGGGGVNCVEFREILQNSSPLKPLV